jgi:phage gpG-like protein
MALQFEMGSSDVINIAMVIREMAARARNMTPVMDQIAEYTMNVVGSNFETQGNRASGGWPKLSVEQVKFKARKGYDPRILHMEGRLRDSVTRRGAKNQVLKIGKDQMILGTTLPYGRTHQIGDPSRKIPKRAFLELTDADRRVLGQLVSEDLIEPLRVASRISTKAPIYTVKTKPAWPGARVGRGRGGRFVSRTTGSNRRGD